MENSQDLINTEGDGDGRKPTASTSSTSGGVARSGYRLFGREASIYQCLGGGKVADILLWKRWYISFGVIVVATAAWFLFEQTGLPFLSICSDVLLILVLMLFLHSNYASLRNKQLKTFPELVVSEEMVNNAAASFRVKINNVLLMAHDITLGKDFRLFFKVVVCLWLLSVIGSFFSFFTLAYIGTIISIIIPALYSKFEDHVDRYFGLIHQQFSKHYRIVDESVFNSLPRSISKDKDS
ncbi:Reticulon-like protein [Quillaja saponaria]|uniref:Reticulon-like protein n=1 Tax=Quillaja saponaria TaxID=32244 RepID=A0AAD7PRD0_QUISA|nr:Reticulon-like protein [Quillaja saponaria]